MEAKGKSGRPAVVTEEHREAIQSLVDLGYQPEEFAHLFGVSPAGMRDAMRRLVILTRRQQAKSRMQQLMSNIETKGGK